MSEQWNEIQREAITDLEHSIVLHAGAGAGKTKVLTNRFFRIIEKGQEEGKNLRILAITFTKKASREMQNRIMSLVAGDKKKLESLNHSSVQTIDSFCTDLVRQYAPILGISPGFSVMEEYQSKGILSEIIGETLRTAYVQEPIFREFMEEMEWNFSKGEKEFFDLYMDLRQNGNLDQFVPREIKGRENPLEEGKQIMKDLRELSMGKTTKAYKHLYGEKAESFYSGLLSQEEEWAFIEETPSACSRLSGGKEFLEGLKSLVEKRKGEEEHKNIPYIEKISELLQEIHKKYWARKREEEKLDFGDLLEQSLKLLEREDLREEIQNLYDYVLVDEFQDTNLQQIQLIRTLSQKGNLFIVGDKKQSIYGFRGSDVTSSQEFTKKMVEEGFRELIMSKNYRSSTELMDRMNAFFQDKMEEYSPLEGHQSLGDFVYGIKNLVEEKQSKEEKITAEAEYIAREFLENRKNSNLETMALLLRTSTQMPIYEEVFRKWNIPFVNRKSQGFFQQREIMDLLLLLESLFQSENKISQIGVLRSPFVGLEDSSIYKMYKEDLEWEEGEEKSKWERWKKKQEQWKRELERGEISSFLEKIYWMEGYEDFVKEEYGEQGVENLLDFLEMARHYEEEFEDSLVGFLSYIHKKKQWEDPAQPDIFSSEKYIEISTIHGSKGLEYDVVFLGDLSASGRKTKQDLNFSREYGPGIQWDGRDYIHGKNLEVRDQFEEEEQLRLLYVGMTRAKKQLHLLKSSEDDKGFMKYFQDFPYEIPEREYTNTKLEESPKEEEPLIQPSYRQKKRQISISPSKLLREEREISVYEEAIGKEKKADEVGNLLHLYAALTKSPNGKIQEKILEKATEILSEEEKNRLESLLEKYNRRLEKVEVLSTEMPFQIPLEGFHLEGIFDQMAKDEEGIKLIDIKTGRRGAKTASMPQYKKQLQLYGIAWRRIYGEEIPLELLFLETGEEVSVENISEWEEKTWLENLERTYFDRMKTE
ncbi:UvrD-helicase domain-containing protein [Peptoniphilus sp. KCTC 25270]|uniref:UvrD-helicase domain-containing protein n=1 Tax=Peptoniphilus sp. KCTC 25270 TaxID=2897414 RepID=UPI001E47010E|nr:UvrD-helicase domain-containing protein [Peptoniphilus sp. KCTC 25270]MCD1146515.1 UvrD-helicase domain-containing protein [Peptoniphilus sp. KCTC 25270]